MDFEKVASDAFVDELRKIASKANDETLLEILVGDTEALFKEAFSAMPAFQRMGQGIQSARDTLQRGVGRAAGSLQASSFAPIRGAGKALQVANTPHQELGAQMAHKGHEMMQSPSAFKQGVGQALHHKGEAWQKPGMRGAANALWSMANPVGTAAEVGATGVGAAAAKGLQGVGQRLAAPVDAVTAQGRAMTPVGRLQNAVSGVGQGVQQTFSPGGTGHNVLTKHIPHALEMAGPAAMGTAIHLPMGAAGLLGGKLMGATGTALGHAAGEGVSHLVSDVVGTKAPMMAGHVGGRLINKFAPAAAAAAMR